ncbi:hypothetical protein FWF93_00485 [Candidatus Saccharibacteria bacterium]|nr:hypothetical protein [Candidatus Saccharibacteria bacterium]
MGLFSKKSVKANEPFNPFVGNNAVGPIDVTPVASTDDIAKPEEAVEATEDTIESAVEEMTEEIPAEAEEITSTEIPVTSDEDLAAVEAPEAIATVDDIDAPKSALEDLATEDSASVATAAEDVAATVVAETAELETEPVQTVDDLLTPDEETATAEEPAVELAAEGSIIDSLQEEPEVTEESLAAVAEESIEAIDETASDSSEAIVETDAAPDIEESLIPADSAVEEVAAAETGEPAFEAPAKKSKSSVILLIIAALVCVGLAGVSAMLYVKWQDQQNLTVEKEEIINNLTQEKNDSDLVNSDITELSDEITELKEENKALNEDKLKLEENNKTLDEKNKELKAQVEKLQAENSEPADGTSNP